MVFFFRQPEMVLWLSEYQNLWSEGLMTIGFTNFASKKANSASNTVSLSATFHTALLALLLGGG